MSNDLSSLKASIDMALNAIRGGGRCFRIEAQVEESTGTIRA